MAETALDYFDWKTITERILAGQCVPFLGAGANVSSSDGKYQGLLLGGDVSSRMVQRWMGLKEGIDLEQLTKLPVHEQILSSPGYEHFKEDYKDRRERFGRNPHTR